jgi:uncharacterized protein (DUF362 family)
MDNPIKVAVIRTDRRRGGVAEALSLLADDLAGCVRDDPDPCVLSSVDASFSWARTHPDTLSALTDATLSAGASSLQVLVRETTNRDRSFPLTRRFQAELRGRPVAFHGYGPAEPEDWYTLRWIGPSGEPTALRVPRRLAASRSRILLGTMRTHPMFRVGLGLAALATSVHPHDRQRVGGWDEPKYNWPGRGLISALTGVSGGLLTRCWMGIRTISGGMRLTSPERRRLQLIRSATDQLVALTSLLMPRISVIDGFVGMEGEGPRLGPPVRVGAIVAGNNPVAVDAVAAAIMGFDPMQIDLLRQAQALRLGPADLQAIQLLGDAPELVRRRFRPHPADRLARLASRPTTLRAHGGVPAPHFGAVPPTLRDPHQGAGASHAHRV